MKLTTRIAVTTLILAGGVGRGTATAQRPDISGRWTFNASQSDKPRDMMQGDTAGGEQRGEGRRGGFGGAQSDSTVTLTPESDSALVLSSDGRKIKQKVDGGGDIEIKGRWQGNDFVVERKVSGAGKVTEDYLLSQDKKQLFVIVNVQGPRGRDIEFRRVYDATTS
ncbi:MAG TPA: hypothetical protein VM716_16545 [Gemmatimonadales bacterium]|nr:hypothetical protein [Gemmatimonadales bacterium]